MSHHWVTPLVEKLDSQTEPMYFFFRDDDAGWDDVALLALCDRFRGKATLDIAAIPMAVHNKLARELSSRHDHVAVHQHGFAHVNHAKSGKKCEFGPDRTNDAVVRDIQNGWAQLSDLFEKHASTNVHSAVEPLQRSHRSGAGKSWVPGLVPGSRRTPIWNCGALRGARGR